MLIATADAKTIFEDLYRSVFALPHLSAEGRFRAFETAVEHLPYPTFVFWEIVGITPAALEFLAAKDFADAKGVQRSHDMSRRKRGDLMFNRAEPMVDAYDFFYRHDKTIIALKSENDGDAFCRDSVIEIDNAVFGRHTYSISMSKKVRAYLSSVHASRDARTKETIDASAR